MLPVLSVAVDSLAYGMVLFVISIGLSVTLGLMRIVNLAHGAFAMIGGYLASYALQSLGLGFIAAVGVAVLGTLLILIPVEQWLYKRIYGSSELTQVLMTIGITFVVIGLANFIFGPTLKTVTLPAILEVPIDLGFRVIAAHRVFAIGCGLIVAFGLWFLIERTRFGILLRASVDNASMAAALGVRTEMIYAVSFTISAALAAFGGIIGAQLLPIEPFYALRYMAVFLVVVSVGGAGSIQGTLAASLLLGGIDTATRYWMPEYGEFFLYFSVILIVWIFPRGLLGGGDEFQPVERAPPNQSVPHTVGPGAILLLLTAGWFLFPDNLALLTRIISIAFLVLSLDLITGYGGVASLSQAAPFGVGAYAAGIAAVQFGVQDPIAMTLIGILGGSVAGLVSGIVILRGRGLAQLVLSIALIHLFHELANKASFWTGGSDGLSGIAPAPLLGWFEFDLWGRTAYLYGGGILTIAFFLLTVLVRSPFGMLCRGIKEDPVRVRSMGASPWVALLKLFTLAGSVAGAGGALNAISTQVVGLDGLSFTLSAEALVMLVLGGSGSLFGALAGALLFMLFKNFVAAINPFHWLSFVGCLLIAVVLFVPKGIYGGMVGLLTSRKPRP